VVWGDLWRGGLWVKMRRRFEGKGKEKEKESVQRAAPNEFESPGLPSL